MNVRYSTPALVFFFLPLAAWCQSSVDNQPPTDSIGNIVGEQHDWVKKGEFRGKRILLACYYVASTGDNAEPYPDVCNVLRAIGFTVDSQAIQGRLPDLDSYDQCWIVSGTGNTGFGAEDIKAIRQFVNRGKGVYMLADNMPFLYEANQVATALHNVTIQGNYPGEQLIHVTQGQQGNSGAGKKITGMKGGKLWAADHELLSGLKAIYEGTSISHLSESPKLYVVLRASNNLPLVSVSTNPRELIVYDCGFTRMYYKWAENIVSSSRWYQNVAAYLMGKKRQDLGSNNTVREESSGVQGSQLGLAGANKSNRRKILNGLYEKKGREATLALAGAISVLPDDEKRAARNLLVKRLKRMKVSTLSKYLADEDRAELRLAAAKAAGLKNNREMTEPLIQAMSDPSKRVAQAAHESLKKITQQDFGAFPSDSTLKKHSLIKRWKQWWSANGAQ
jgi:hypothetical protein